MTTPFKDATAKYEENQVKRGLQRLTVWIPSTQRKNILAYIERKRLAHKKEVANGL